MHARSKRRETKEKHHSEPVPPLAAVDREPDVRAGNRQAKDDELHESPEPATAAGIFGRLLTLVLVPAVVLLRR